MAPTIPAAIPTRRRRPKAAGAGKNGNAQTVTFEWLQQQKKNGRKDRDVGHHPCNVLGDRQGLAEGRPLDSGGVSPRPPLRSLCARSSPPLHPPGFSNRRCRNAGAELRLLRQRAIALRTSCHISSPDNSSAANSLKRISRRTLRRDDNHLLSCLRSAALLIFLAAAARTGIVAADLIAAHYLLHRPLALASRHPRLVQFAAFAALELRFHIVDGGRHALLSAPR